jgi:signal transduction histidine kinase
MRDRKKWRSPIGQTTRGIVRPSLFLGLLYAGALLAGAQGEEIKGIPFIRTYPLDEIGSVPRGLRPGFDSFGRFAVMYDGIYAVLNDSTWVNRIDEASADRIRITTVRVVDGKYFYGGRGSWGAVELTPEGNFRAHPLVPPDAPAWTGVTAFNEVLGTRTGVYFYERNGVVYWDFARRRNFFFELPWVMALFRVGDRVFVSCQDKVLREILPEQGTIRVVSDTGLDGAVVEYAAPLDASHTLLALTDGRLVRFDGHTTAPWPPQAQFGFTGQISALMPLVDGGVALALSARGLFLLSADGSLRWALSLPEFRRVGALAANEPGVLWVAGENAVHKIFYDSPLTSFGQQLGLMAAWPAIVTWNDRIVVCSNGTLYELEPADPGAPARFKAMPHAPEGTALSLASRGSHLLVGNATGVFSAGSDGAFTRIVRMENVASLVFLEPDLGIAIGSREIAAVRYAEGRWTECAPRITGVGDAPVRSLVHGAIWLEMGGDRVARLTYREGRLALQRIPLPWSGAQWTNVGAVGPTIILSGSLGERAYYDETRETLGPAPALDRLLNRSPYWISRVTEDASGTLWATYAQGVVTFTPENGDYVVDAATFELRNDSYPEIAVLPGNSIWVTTARSLFHVERPAGHPRTRPPALLVSLVADHLNLELRQQTSTPVLPPQFAFDDNSLSVRFFSGTYAWRYPPLYEYRLGAAESWTPVDPGLLLRFPKLRDGRYRLEVRPAVHSATEPPAFQLDFVVKPPGYRTPLAYAAYALVLLLLIAGLTRWTNHRSLQRNAALEHLVQERTQQLHVTMEKLNEETRNTATLAERSRLAGEIHDSLQQGLSGSILQLDTTMTTAMIPPEVRSRLDIVRKMLSYTREEIQHSVWNLESPLLQNSNLGDALRMLASFIDSGTIRVNVAAPAQPILLEPAVQHHLLRIAQEAITNAVKHANASRVDVTLHAHPDSVLLTIADDGAGFDPAVRSTVEGHFGIRGIHTRARSIGAELHVRSSPGHSTIIQVSLPSPQLLPHDATGQTQST